MMKELMKTKEVQKWLKKYGYYKGDIDGISGVLTINAIIANTIRGNPFNTKNMRLLTSIL